MTTLIDDRETILLSGADPAGDPCHPLADMARMRCWAQEEGVEEELKALHRPSIGRSLATALGDWLLIFGGFGAVVMGGAFVAPFAVILIGHRQRALGNLLHDASHGSFAGVGRQADLLADCLLFLPLCTIRTLDCREQSAQARSWAGSILGDLPRADGRSRARMLAFWGTVLLTIALLLRPSDALLFAALWLGSRATSFHLITTFREMSDRVRRPPGALDGVSRARTVAALHGILFRPHDDGYRLARHLNPEMPFFALPRAHALLMRWPDYAAAAHHAAPASRVHMDPNHLEPFHLQSSGDAKHLIDLLYPAAGEE